jgi:stress-induced morphogen
MAVTLKQENATTHRIETVLRPEFPSAECYQYNAGAIRIRIVDERFAGKSQLQRERTVLPLLRKLPAEIQAEISMLALVTDDERSYSLVSLEFDDPRPSGR